MVSTSPDASSRGSMLLYTVAALVDVVLSAYGLWVAVAYDGGTALLIPFAALAAIGALLALASLSGRHERRIGLGLVLALMAPTGFAWPACLLVAGIGVLALMRSRRHGTATTGR